MTFIHRHVCIPKTTASGGTQPLSPSYKPHNNFKSFFSISTISPLSIFPIQVLSSLFIFIYNHKNLYCI
ncbi:hypothetical protein L6452_25157 [Arctium lappa]|uniref:Uncharacterized protein n=1 Tax=Arctium lappa TaxID=4217 RepID=A0ACB9AEZ3_ARCLA|nr:hypothetical protein L6452_25157 [Arctium lappa]